MRSHVRFFARRIGVSAARFCSRRIKRIGVPLVAIGLASCAPFGARLDTPEPEQVFAYVKAFELHLGVRIDTGNDYVQAGFAYIDHHCELFFTELEIEKRKLLFAKSSVQQAFTTAPIIVKAAHDKNTDISKALTVLSALAGLTSSVFDYYQTQFIFAPYGAQLRLKVQQAQVTYRDALKSDTAALTALNASIRGGGAATTFVAHQIVQKYAQLCTIPQFDLYIVTALDSTRAENKPQPILLRCAAECDPHLAREKDYQACLALCKKRELDKLAKSAADQSNKLVFYELDAQPAKKKKKSKSGEPPGQSPIIFSSPPIVSQPR